MRNEDYERGYYVATQRAINRTALGLPLDRPSNDAEISRAARLERGDMTAHLYLGPIGGTRVPGKAEG